MRNVLIVLCAVFLCASLGLCNEKMSKKEKGQMYLSAPTVTKTATANVYVPVSGNFTDGMIKNFVLNSNGTLTYIGYGNDILFNGVSDVETNKNCTMTYTLYRNGSYVAGAETPHVFHGVSITETISITRILYAEHGDTFQIYCKSDQADTELLVSGLCITLWGR